MSKRNYSLAQWDHVKSQAILSYGLVKSGRTISDIACELKVSPQTIRNRYEDIVKGVIKIDPREVSEVLQAYVMNRNLINYKPKLEEMSENTENKIRAAQTYPHTFSKRQDMMLTYGKEIPQSFINSQIRGIEYTPSNSSTNASKTSKLPPKQEYEKTMKRMISKNIPAQAMLGLTPGTTEFAKFENERGPVQPMSRGDATYDQAYEDFKYYEKQYELNPNQKNYERLISTRNTLGNAML